MVWDFQDCVVSIVMKKVDFLWVCGGRVENLFTTTSICSLFSSVIIYNVCAIKLKKTPFFSFITNFSYLAHKYFSYYKICVTPII